MLKQVLGSSMTMRACFAGVASLLGLALANSAWAYSSYDYVDVDPVFKPLTSSLSGTFNIKNPGTNCFLSICDSGGFDPEKQNVSAARIDFVFFDVEFGNDEIASIVLGDDLQGPVSVDGDDRFLFIFYLEHFDANPNVVLQLSDHGTLDWTVTLPGAGALEATATTGQVGTNCGDYDKPPFLKAGILKAAGEPIPEPNAALLFCLGFAVVGTATRRPTKH